LCEPSVPSLSRTGPKSPDDKWIVGAVTTQDIQSRPPNAHTTVYLKSVNGSDTKESILVFPDEIFKEKGKIELSFLWTAPNHLDVLLSKMPIFDTQVTRYAGIDISVSTGNLEIQPPPSPARIAAVLSGTDLKAARKVMLDLHCIPQMTEQVSVVRQAWHDLGSTISTEVTQDHLIQALMAQCLIEAQAANSAPDPDIDSAIALLKSAVRSDEILEALAGAEGLIHYDDPRDNQSIIDITHREPKAITFLSTALSYNCSPNVARTLQLMREQAPDPATKDKIDANIKRAEPQRRAKCDTSAAGNK
jgi:hypothetical protein